MAGAEKKPAWCADRADLFANTVCIVTPTKKQTGPGAARKNRNSLAGGRSRVLELKPEIHDALGSRRATCRMLSRRMMATHVFKPAKLQTPTALCANGFRITTRIASGSPRKCGATSRWPTGKISAGHWTPSLAIAKIPRVLAKADVKAIANVFLKRAKNAATTGAARLRLAFSRMNQPPMKTGKQAK